MHVFYQPDLSAETIVLDEEESKHAVRVLRMKKGDEAHLADGKGTHALATVSDDNPKKCALVIRERKLHKQTRNYYLHIVVAPAKNFDRMEWFIEKAVECGIDEISFVETKNGERTKVNMERCRKIAISAMKQSKQWWLPVIHDMAKPDVLLQQLPGNAQKLIAWCEADKQDLFSRELAAGNDEIIIMIGPEGDFTAGEVSMAVQAGFRPVSLGESILRTETAALYACMAAKALRSRQ